MVKIFFITVYDHIALFLFHTLHYCTYILEAAAGGVL